MNQYAWIYWSYRTKLFRLIRLLLFIILVLLLIAAFVDGVFLKKTFGLLLIFLSIEVFFRFNIASRTPLIDVIKNDGKNIFDSFTLQALGIGQSSIDTGKLIKKLTSKPQIRFILEKSNIETKEISPVNVPKDQIFKDAFNLVKDLKGKFVTTMDIFAAYILLTEPDTKILFSKKLKREELLHILYWAREKFPDEENPRKTKINFWGAGIGEDWVTGWTLETKKYAQDITPRVLRRNPNLAGRDKEYQMIIEALHKKEKNNILLVGEPGTGKTTLIEFLALNSHLGNLPKELCNRRFFELMVGSLLAGLEKQGDLELRLKTIVEEISHAENVVVYVPEFQDVVGASTFHVDLSGALIPYLRDGKVPIIGSVTPAQYKRFIEPNHTLLDVFQVVRIEEPEEESTTQMLLEKATEIERKNRVEITYRAIIASIEYAKQYLPGKFLPGAAVVLLDDSANRVFLSSKKKVEESDVIKVVEDKTKIAVAAPVGEEKELLLNLEEKIHEKIIDQTEAVTAIAEALRRLRTGLLSKDKPISFLFLGPTGVGKTETAKALSSVYYKREENMIRLDMSEYTTMDGVKRLLGASPGEGDERGELIDKVFENPFSLILLDEFEKANPSILDLFLQVFEDGRLTDNKGRTVSFINNIIIATSNAGSEFIRQKIEKEGGITDHKKFQQELTDYLQKEHIFKPELLNRFDSVIIFKPLKEAEIKEVTKLMLKKITENLLKQDINLNFDDKIITKIAGESYDPQFGARPIRRFIQDNIEDLIAQKILKEEVKRGSSITFSTDDANNITFTTN